jgi:hypothetical protein
LVAMQKASRMGAGSTSAADVVGDAAGETLFQTLDFLLQHLDRCLHRCMLRLQGATEFEGRLELGGQRAEALGELVECRGGRGREPGVGKL